MKTQRRFYFFIVSMQWRKPPPPPAPLSVHAGQGGTCGGVSEALSQGQHSLRPFRIPNSPSGPFDVSPISGIQ